MNKCKVCKKEVGISDYICINGKDYYHIGCRTKEKNKCKSCGREI